MALVDVNQTVDSGHKGGGLLGAIVGGVAGLAAGVATAFTGGAAAPSIPAALGLGASLAGAGSTIGNMAGESIDPTKAPEANQRLAHDNTAPPPISSPIDSMQNHPEMQMAHLADAKSALKDEGSLPGPVYDQYLSMINQAQQKLQQRLGVGNQP